MKRRCASGKGVTKTQVIMIIVVIIIVVGLAYFLALPAPTPTPIPVPTSTPTPTPTPTPSLTPTPIPTPTPVPTSLGNLKVQVKDVKNNPIGGAIVSISGPQSAHGTTHTDGQYIFIDIEVGNYSIKVEKAGYKSGLTQINISPRTNKTIIITLNKMKEFVLTAHILNITVMEYGFNGTSPGPMIIVGQGDVVKMTITVPKGDIAHIFAIDEFDVLSDTIAPGNSYTLDFIADKPGTFYYYCPLPGHRALGMEGQFIVQV